jgi:hypothetical protein
MDSDCLVDETCNASCDGSGLDCANEDPTFCIETCDSDDPPRLCSSTGNACTLDVDCPIANVCEPGILRQGYSERPLTDQAEELRSLAVADIDNDGILDIITGSFFEVLWHAGGASEACLCFDVVGSGSTVDRPDYCRATTVEPGDREIDGGELALLGAAFNGSCAAPFDAWECGADFNGDGKIDGNDLAILSSFGVWGAVVAPDLDPDSTEVKDACSFTCP